LNPGEVTEKVRY